MTEDDYDALSQKHLASIKRDMRVSLEDAAVRATHKVMAELDCVGWFGYDTGLRLWFETNKGDDGAIPLYKDQSQRTWVKLTDEDMNKALDYWSDDSRSAYGGAHAANGEYVDMIETWRYIESKLKERNT